MFGLFRKKEGGYIRALGLVKFWKLATEEEKQRMREAFAKTFYPEEFNLAQIDGKDHHIQTELSASDFLFKVAVKLTNQKQYMLAEKCLNEAAKREKLPEKKHVILTELIDVYYKQRMEREDAIHKCMAICRKNILLAPKLVEKDKEFPAFKRLAIILENEQQYEEAIQIAELALSYGLTDGTKGGYAGRIEKLKTKLS